MVTIKKFIFFVLIAGGIKFTATAQGFGRWRNATPTERAQYQTDIMAKKLLLDARQVTETQAINLKYALQFQPILKSTENRDVRIKKAMALQNDKDAELKGVFTTDQFKKYKDYEQKLEKMAISRLM